MINKLKTVISIVRKFRKETILYENQPVKFFNFWKFKGEPQDSWFQDFIRLRNINPDSKEIAFFSVYGSRYTIPLYRGKRKVFYTGENVHPSQPNYTKQYGNHQLDKVDLAMGFEYINALNYLRFPLWILYIIKPDSPLEDIRNMLQNMAGNRGNVLQRTGFACMVASHDTNGIRTKIYNAVSTLGTVESGGALLNNTTDLWKRYNNDKSLFIKNYQFNICPENSNVSGYVTEKIFQSIQAGCIPIYWGSSNNPEPEVLNKNAIIFYDDKDNGCSMMDQITALKGDPKLLQLFVSQNPFTNHAAEFIHDKLNNLERELRRLFKTQI